MYIKRPDLTFFQFSQRFGETVTNKWKTKNEMYGFLTLKIQNVFEVSFKARPNYLQGSTYGS